MSFSNASFKLKNVYPSSVRIGLMDPNIAQTWAQRVVSDGTTIASVKKGDTINHTTSQPIATGLFCQRIFGPCLDYTCACGHEKIRIHLNVNVSPPICPECHVEWTESSVRRQRLGSIELISPVTHKWFSDNRNYIPILTGITVKTFKSLKECKLFFPFSLQNIDQKKQELVTLEQDLSKLAHKKATEHLHPKEADLEALDFSFDSALIALGQRPPTLALAPPRLAKHATLAKGHNTLEALESRGIGPKLNPNINKTLTTTWTRTKESSIQQPNDENEVVKSEKIQQIFNSSRTFFKQTTQRAMQALLFLVKCDTSLNTTQRTKKLFVQKTKKKNFYFEIATVRILKKNIIFLCINSKYKKENKENYSASSQASTEDSGRGNHMAFLVKDGTFGTHPSVQNPKKREEKPQKKSKIKRVNFSNLEELQSSSFSLLGPNLKKTNYNFTNINASLKFKHKETFIRSALCEGNLFSNLKIRSWTTKRVGLSVTNDLPLALYLEARKNFRSTVSLPIAFSKQNIKQNLKNIVKKAFHPLVIGSISFARLGLAQDLAIARPSFALGQSPLPGGLWPSAVARPSEARFAGGLWPSAVAKHNQGLAFKIPKKSKGKSLFKPLNHYFKLESSSKKNLEYVRRLAQVNQVTPTGFASQQSQALEDKGKNELGLERSLSLSLYPSYGQKQNPDPLPEPFKNSEKLFENMEYGRRLYLKNEQTKILPKQQAKHYLELKAFGVLKNKASGLGQANALAWPSYRRPSTTFKAKHGFVPKLKPFLKSLKVVQNFSDKSFKLDFFSSNHNFPVRPSFTQPEDFRRQFVKFLGNNGSIKSTDISIERYKFKGNLEALNFQTNLSQIGHVYKGLRKGTEIFAPELFNYPSPYFFPICQNKTNIDSARKMPKLTESQNQTPNNFRISGALFQKNKPLKRLANHSPRVKVKLHRNYANLDQRPSKALIALGLGPSCATLSTAKAVQNKPPTKALAKPSLAFSVASGLCPSTLALAPPRLAFSVASGLCPSTLAKGRATLNPLEARPQALHQSQKDKPSEKLGLGLTKHLLGISQISSLCFANQSLSLSKGLAKHATLNKTLNQGLWFDTGLKPRMFNNSPFSDPSLTQGKYPLWTNTLMRIWHANKYNLLRAAFGGAPGFSLVFSRQAKQNLQSSKALGQYQTVLKPQRPLDVSRPVLDKVKKSVSAQFSYSEQEVYFSETKSLAKEQTVKTILSQTGGGGLQQYLGLLNLEQLVHILQNDLFEIAPRLAKSYSKRRILLQILNETSKDLNETYNLLKQTQTSRSVKPNVGEANALAWPRPSEALATLEASAVATAVNKKKKEKHLILQQMFSLNSFLGVKVESLEKKCKHLKKQYKIIKKISCDFQNRKNAHKRRKKLAFQLLKTRSNPAGMTLSSVPVLPPGLRPIIDVPKIGPITADLNIRYRGLIFALRNLRELSYVDFRNAGAAQASVQEAVDDLLYTGGKARKDKQTVVPNLYKSIAMRLKGKHGRFRGNLLGKRVDYSGRSVIVVGPTLKIHQCGLPFEIAIKLFNPFLIRRLIQKGLCKNVYKAKQILLEGKFKPLIWSLCREVMLEHLVLLNRAPTLHRLGVQAFMPILISGRAILLHPLVCTGFNADFDGDQMGVHVPLFPKARAEAWKMMWSRNNFLSPSSGEPILLPSQDMVLGCYYLTESPLLLLPSKTKPYYSNFKTLDITSKNANFISNELLFVPSQKKKTPMANLRKEKSLIYLIAVPKTKNLLALGERSTRPHYVKKKTKDQKEVYRDFAKRGINYYSLSQKPFWSLAFKSELIKWSHRLALFKKQKASQVKGFGTYYKVENSFLQKNFVMGLCGSLDLLFETKASAKVCDPIHSSNFFLGSIKPGSRNLLSNHYSKIKNFQVFSVQSVLDKYRRGLLNIQSIVWINVNKKVEIPENQNYSQNFKQLDLKTGISKENCVSPNRPTLSQANELVRSNTFSSSNNLARRIESSYSPKTEGDAGLASPIAIAKHGHAFSVASATLPSSSKARASKPRPSLELGLSHPMEALALGQSKSLASADGLGFTTPSAKLERSPKRLKPLFRQGQALASGLWTSYANVAQNQRLWLRKPKGTGTSVLEKSLTEKSSNDYDHQYNKKWEGDNSITSPLELIITPYGITRVLQTGGSKKSFFNNSILLPVKRTLQVFEVLSIRTTVGRLLFNDVLEKI